MVYKAIGLMSGSSLDGLDIAYVHFQENGGRWSMEIQHTACYPYSADWFEKLRGATQLSALDYLLLHSDYGRFLGDSVNKFIAHFGLEHQVDMVCSHGHTSFHLPIRGMTHQLGEGAALAAVTGLPVISDLRALDIGFGGQGAPIVPIGEKLLLGEYRFLLNLGGIANLSFRDGIHYYGFDVCPANRILNLLVQPLGLTMDKDGKLASEGKTDEELLEKLQALDYYGLTYPKSLDNAFGIETVFPLVSESALSVEDALHTYIEHIALQVAASIRGILQKQTGSSGNQDLSPETWQLLLTGGGALNAFLVSRLEAHLIPLGVHLVVPDQQLVEYKEAVIMALIGVLRWREEFNVISTVTGAVRESIGGALWLGTEA